MIELTACLFDGSCIIFTFFKMAYDAGVPFSTLWWFFVGLAGGVYALLILAWIVNAKELKESRAVDSTPSAEEAKSPHADSLPSKPLLEQVRTLEFVAVCLYAAGDAHVSDAKSPRGDDMWTWATRPALDPTLKRGRQRTF